jgi:hypothetical protein
LVQEPVPAQTARQSRVQSLSTQLPVPLQLRLQPLPGQWSVVCPAPEALTLQSPPPQKTSALPIPVTPTTQPPASQFTVHEPVPAQDMLHPAPLQLNVQASASVHAQAWPGSQTVSALSLQAAAATTSRGRLIFNIVLGFIDDLLRSSDHERGDAAPRREHDYTQ